MTATDIWLITIGISIMVGIFAPFFDTPDSTYSFGERLLMLFLSLIIIGGIGGLITHCIASVIILNWDRFTIENLIFVFSSYVSKILIGMIIPAIVFGVIKLNKISPYKLTFTKKFEEVKELEEAKIMTPVSITSTFEDNLV